MHELPGPKEPDGERCMGIGFHRLPYHGVNVLPLAKYTVLDLTIARAGPTAVRLLADWGRERHQDRAAAGTRPHACQGHRRAARTRRAEHAPQQARPDHRPEESGRQQVVHGPGDEGGRGGRELPCRREAPPRRRLRNGAQREPEDHLREHLGIRAGRSVSRSSRRGPDRPGHLRAHVRDRPSRTGAGARRHRDQRHLGGHVPRPGHSACPAAP